ncbi:MAG: hypothetical protein KatS3mg035_1037 [Bacteroidia bacterium]|nr:MAG: hypothetical protein KatS3mg035_1037 [Bacteroidia bacterium]
MAKTKEKLTPADKKFILKFFGEVDFDAKTITRRNPISGEEVEVDPIFALMFDFIMKVQRAIYIQSNVELQKIHPALKITNAVMNFDRARMIALKMDSKAYMALLD